MLAVTALGPDVPAARAAAERAADAMPWDGMQRRHDIAATLPDEVHEPEPGADRGCWPRPVPEPAR